MTGGKHTERGEEPSVLAAGVSVLEHLLDSLLGVLALRHLLEGVVGDGALEALELQGVASGHQVVVVDDLDEGLDLGSLLLASLGHAAGDLGGVALNTGDQGVAEGMRLVAVVNGLDDDNLESNSSQRCVLEQPVSSKILLPSPVPFDDTHKSANTILSGAAQLEEVRDVASVVPSFRRICRE